MRWRRPGRRLLAPEVIQTSTVDCGPAALKSVLNGFGISANLGRLREACQTQLDGTSIDSIEDIAGRLGLLAEQVIVPLEHVFLPGAGTLPAIAVTDTPDGTLHFVVLWRVLGPWVQVMDPRVGRRWARVSVLSRQLHVHSMLMPAQDWRAWAGSPANTGALRHRAMRLGLGRRRARTLLRRAEGDEAWHGFAILDAALRMVSALVGRGGVLRGAEAARLAASLVRRAEAGGLDAAIPNPFRAVQAMAADAGDLLVQGVVLLAVRGRMARPAGPDPAFAEIGAILSEADPKPLRVVAAAALADGFLRLTVVGLALFALSSLVVVEGLLLRGLLGLSQSLAPGLQRLVAVTLILGFFVVQLMVEAATQAELLRLGRAVEARLRILFLGKMRTLDLSYFQSRPTSDLADRCHNLHALRAFPLLLAQILRAALVLSTTTFGLLWLIPGAAAIVLPLLGVALAVPLLLQPVLMERDLRFRTQAGALTRFYLDALLGMTPIRAHSAERSVLIEHESFLVDWRQTGLQLLLANLWIGAAEALIGVVLAMAAVSLYSGRDAEHGNLLLLAFWAMSLPMLAQAAAQSVQAYPNLRSIGLRLLEPLGVFGANNARQGEADAAASTPAAPGEGVRIEMRGIRLRAGASLVLDGIDLDVAPGSHIAIVGPSGSGKSSLVGLLLGWRRPSEGELVVDGQPFDAPRLREQTAWVDPSVQLWNESLFDNIVYGARGEDMDSMGDALSSGDLRGFVGRLPDGLQTALGENGALASGGEGQRVRFARAMMRPEARLVILDEPFRGLDRGARHRLLARARAKWPGATLLCVTHDVGETRAFARVIVMDGGRIVEDDDPERLAARETSRYRAFLDAEREVAKRLWAGAMWQRWRIRDATLHRDPRMQDTGDAACRDDADASG